MRVDKNFTVAETESFKQAQPAEVINLTQCDKWVSEDLQMTVKEAEEELSLVLTKLEDSLEEDRKKGLRFGLDSCSRKTKKIASRLFSLIQAYAYSDYSCPPKDTYIKITHFVASAIYELLLQLVYGKEYCGTEPRDSNLTLSDMCEMLLFDAFV